MPSSSSRAAPTDASACMLIGRAGIGERPMPGGSNAMVRNPVRYGSNGSHTPAWDQMGEYISRGSPSPRIWAWMRCPLRRNSQCAMRLAEVTGVMGIPPLSVRGCVLTWRPLSVTCHLAPFAPAHKVGLVDLWAQVVRVGHAGPERIGPSARDLRPVAMRPLAAPTLTGASERHAEMIFAEMANATRVRPAQWPGFDR